nr:hypothetical protein [Streptomyces noursei]
MTGTGAEGADEVVARAGKIASYGLHFALLHILMSRENTALSLHNTARRGDVRLDERLFTVCRLPPAACRLSPVACATARSRAWRPTSPTSRA